jgi:hypothetical protein
MKAFYYSQDVVEIGTNRKTLPTLCRNSWIKKKILKKQEKPKNLWELFQILIEIS